MLNIDSIPCCRLRIYGNTLLLLRWIFRSVLIAQLEDSVIHMRALPPNLNSAQCNEGKIAHAKDPTDLRKFPQERAKNGVVGRLTDFHE